jgi:hypothetical protein
MVWKNFCFTVLPQPADFRLTEVFSSRKLFLAPRVIKNSCIHRAPKQGVAPDCGAQRRRLDDQYLRQIFVSY